MPHPLLADRPLWALRAVLAGVVASTSAMTIGLLVYLQHPDAHALKLDAVWPIIGAYTVLSGALIGLGAGGGMLLATDWRRHPRAARAPRLLAGAVAGTMLFAMLPAAAGILGFGSLHAPYAGTGAILGGALLAAALFVALWAPELTADDPRPDRPLPLRLLLSSLAALASALTLTALGWLTLLALYGAIPDLPRVHTAIWSMGPLAFTLTASLWITALAGLYIGLTTLGYLTLMRRSPTPPRA